MDRKEVRGRGPLSLVLVDFTLQFAATGHLLTPKSFFYVSTAKKEILVLCIFCIPCLRAWADLRKDLKPGEIIFPN